MSDNDSKQIDDVTTKASGLTLNSKAKEFKPTFNAKAPSFVPRASPAKPVAAAAPAAPAAAPKPMSISIGGAPPAAAKAAPTPVPAPAPVPAVAPAPREEPKAKQESAPAPRPAAAPVALERVNEEIDAEEDLMLDEHFKEHLNVIFIGHVDAGKSTLGGQILHVTGMVDKRTLEKYEREAKEAGRESWYLSWALDTNQEERAKGKTVECGRAYFETTRRRYTILDAPGHKNYVPHMLSGAAQADVGVLIISARKGEFETGFERGGQTQEHAILAKTAGVRHLVVAINKMDDKTVEWSKERYDEIISKMTTFLRGTGYNPRTDLTFIPISGYTGAGVKDRVGSACPWYSGPSLLETLDGLQTIERKINGPLRIPISEKHSEQGTAVISGKIESGNVKLNQKVIIMPDRLTCEVVGIFSEDENSAENEKTSAVCGDNVRLRLRGVDDEAISQGYVLTDIKNPCHTTRAFDAQLRILDVKNIITAGYNSVLHVHTAVAEVTMTKLLHKLNKEGLKSRAPPPFVKQRDACIVRIVTNKAICVERFADYPQLGRFTLRDEGKTIAIGKILRLAHPNAGAGSAAASAAHAN
ncbi:translation termination factor GTPase eRF3 [Coemansia linderi]|uniref:Translation termination factor GTPase eRF3 n=1 Tax=Coemansia linderi TaxID=2663919 RepID=A0ACC1KIZ0_9FUNG|nr:translation termination factor GTPase eRF3 [Coemansia linderi]